MTHAGVRLHDRIEIERWPSERPLFLIAMSVSVVLWVMIVISMVGLFYALIFGTLFFVMHLAFIAQVRGSAVRLGPDQFPELHAAVERIARRMGLDPVPDAYLMQAGGSLNAFATRFRRNHLVVLYSDLLEACGENTGARDMIIAHELGHVHAGHLRWHWFLIPAAFVPFLSSALSRAREYTCDRYGLAGAGSTDQALLGLAILSAGAKHGPLVNRKVFVSQRSFLQSGWMTIGSWLASHPPLSQRMLALDPSLAGAEKPSSRGRWRAIAIASAIVYPIVVLAWLGSTRFSKLLDEAKQKAQAQSGVAAGDTTSPSRVRTAAEARSDSLEAARRLAVVGDFLEDERRSGASLPADVRELRARWILKQNGRPIPRDPFDGDYFGYLPAGDRFVVWSSGMDGESETEDDIVWRSPAK